MNQVTALASELGTSDRTLRRAAGQGTLRAERLSPRRLVFPPGETGYLRGHWPLLAELRTRLRTEPNVAFALLFGSVARGDDEGDSDIDLLVVLRDDSLGAMAELQGRLERALGREVDPLSLESASRNELLLTMAIEEGRVLVDRDDCWAALRSRLDELRRRSRSASRRQRREALAAIDEFLA